MGAHFPKSRPLTAAKLGAAVEASGFLRLASQAGGFGAVLHRGDKERGTLLLVVSERGIPACCLARELGADGQYQWAGVGPAGPDQSARDLFLEKRRRNDPDEWQIELDVPSAQRFIAQTTTTG